MSRLIDADALLEHVWRDQLDSRERIANLVKFMPTIEEQSAPPPAHWIPIRRGERGYSAGGFRCSQCGTPDYGRGRTNYCSQCGAWMHGGKQDEQGKQ